MSRFFLSAFNLLNRPRIQIASLLSSAQVTDTYLLALAAAHGGQLATLDGRLQIGAFAHRRNALCFIP